MDAPSDAHDGFAGDVGKGMGMARLRFALVGLVLAGSLAALGNGARADDGPCYDDTWGSVVCAPDWIAEAIWSAADYYGADAGTLFALAACENGYDPDAIGPYGEIGIYQFLPDTFAWLDPGGDIWSVYDQAYTTAWAIVNGWGWLWTCWDRI